MTRGVESLAITYLAFVQALAVSAFESVLGICFHHVFIFT